MGGDGSGVLDDVEDVRCNGNAQVLPIRQTFISFFGLLPDELLERIADDGVADVVDPLDTNKKIH